MFMSPAEVIDKAHKVDYTGWDKDDISPRQQWENKRHPTGEPSLRENKLDDLQGERRGYFSGRSMEQRPYETMPPIKLHKDEAGKTHLKDGHHRLAWSEHERVPFMAVEHH